MTANAMHPASTVTQGRKHPAFPWPGAEEKAQEEEARARRVAALDARAESYREEARRLERGSPPRGPAQASTIPAAEEGQTSTIPAHMEGTGEDGWEVIKEEQTPTLPGWKEGESEGTEDGGGVEEGTQWQTQLIQPRRQYQNWEKASIQANSPYH